MILSKQQLKTIAILAMVINHIGYAFYQNDSVIKSLCIAIGFTTFPIMAYMLVEGFAHTSNLKKYIMRMGAFWTLSIPPFHFVFTPNQAINPLNNIFATLTMSLLMLYLCEKTTSNTFQWIIVLATSLFTMSSDWGIVGPLLIYAIYKNVNVIYVFIGLVLITGISFSSDPMSNNYLTMITLLGYLIPLYLLSHYDNTKQNPSKYKHLFYWIYPLHLSIIALVKHILV